VAEELGQDELNTEGEQLYDHYAKPLEAEHAGKFIAVSREGKTVIGDTILEVAKRAGQELGHGNFVFRLGPRSIGRWR